MWKNWFTFGRKEEKKQGTTARSEVLLKTGNENGTDQRSRTGDLTSLNKNNRDEVNHDHLHASTSSRRSHLDTINKDRFPGSQPRSPFRSRIRYIDNESFASGEQPAIPVMKLKDSGSVLSTPLMPKIKRVIDLNDSLGGNIHVSSPLSRNRTAVPRSQSINYGPTHPTKSTPGRLPVVTLQRRQSLHLVTGPKVLSPSTVKVAPPDQSMLTGTNFRLFTSVMGAPVSPVKSVVDTSTVVSALRERSRKRNTVAASDDSFGDISQIAKRRRQGDSLANVMVPLLPEKLSDLTASQAGLGNSLSTLKQMEQIVSKRPAMASVRRPLLNDDMQESQPASKRDRPQHHNSRVLSSLSSSTRTDYAACAQAKKQMPVIAGLSADQQTRTCQGSGKRTLCAVQPSEVQNGTSATAAKRHTLSCEAPVFVAKAATQSSQTTAANVKDTTSTCAFTSMPVVQEKTALTITPKRKVLSMMASGRMHTDGFPTLGRHLTNPVILASPADMDRDRKEEEARRVNDLLAFLDDDEEGSAATPSTLVLASGLRTTFATAPTSTCAPVAVVTTATTTLAFSSCFAFTTTTTTTTTTQATTPPATTASSLLELLSAPLTAASTSMVSSSLKAPSLSALPSEGSPTSLSKAVTVSLGNSSMLGSSLPAGLCTGLSSSVAGLVHSSGASATDALTSSKPICSTGSSSSSSSSLLSTSAVALGSTAATFMASSLAPLPHLTDIAVSSAPNAAESTTSRPQYTFQPVFGEQTTSAPKSVSSQNNAQPKGGGFSFGGTAAADSTQNASVTPASSSLGGFSFGGVKSQTTMSTTTCASAQSFSFGGANSQTSTAPSTQSFHFGHSDSQTAYAAPPLLSFGGSTVVQTTATAAPPSFSFGDASAQVTSLQSFSFGDSGSSLTALPTAQLMNPNAMSTAQPSSQNFSFGDSCAAPGGSGNSFQFGGTNITSATVSTGATQPFSFGPKPATVVTTADTTALSGGSFGRLTVTANKKSSDVIFGAAAATKFATSPSTFSFGGASNNVTSSGAAGFSFGLHSQPGGQQPNAIAATQSASVLGGSGESKQSTSMFASPQASSTAGSSSGMFGRFGSGLVAQPPFGQSVGTTFATSLNFGAAAPTAGSGNSLSFGSAPATTTASSSFAFGSTLDSSTGPFSFAQPSAGASSRFSFVAPTTTTASSRTITFGQPTMATTAGATNPFSFGQPMSSSAPANGSLPFGGAATTTASGFSFGGAETQASGPSRFSFGSSAGSSTTAPFSFGPNTGNVFGQPSAAPFAISAQAQQQQQTMGFGMQRSQTVPSFPTAHGQSNSTFCGLGSVSSSTGFNFGSSSATPSPAFGLSTQLSTPAFGSSQGPKFGISQSNSSTPVFGTTSNTPVFRASSSASNPSGGGFSFGASTTQKNFDFASSSVGGGGGGAFQFGSPAGGGGGSGSGFNFISTIGATGSSSGTMFTPGAGSAAPRSRVMARPSSSRRSRAGRR